MERTLLTYDEAVDRLQDADVLLFTPSDFMGEVISGGTSSEWSHAAMAAKWRKTWYAIEENGSYNPRGIIPLREYRQSRKGHIDVFRCNHEVDKDAVIERAQFLTAKPYGWNDILRQILLRGFILRLFWKLWVPKEGFNPDGPFFCSATVEDCYRAGGHRLTRRKSIHTVTPADLGQSDALDYLFSIKG